MDNLYAVYTFKNLAIGVLAGYTYIKLKNSLNITYDATLSTDICDIIVLTQNKSFYHSLYV